MADLVREVGLGAKFCRVETLDARIWKGRHLESLGSIERVSRRGKHLIVGDSHHLLVLHLGMTGQLQRREDGRKVRMRFCFEGGSTLVLVDPRCWAKATSIEVSQEQVYFESLGLGEEFWPDLREGHWWRERMGGGRGAVKPALLRQDRVVGVGNIAASEMLWMAGVHPEATLNVLSMAEWNAIAKGASRHVANTLKREDGDSLSYVNEGGSNLFHVYGKAGEGCERRL